MREAISGRPYGPSKLRIRDEIRLCKFEIEKLNCGEPRGSRKGKSERLKKEKTIKREIKNKE